MKGSKCSVYVIAVRGADFVKIGIPMIAPTRTRIWFDTEFIEDGRTIDLLSIGLIREDGATLYLENADANLTRASAWVRENVFPHLQMAHSDRVNCVCFPKADIARQVMEFAGSNPEFWAYYADYDWVALCQLYGTMMDLPQGWPMFCLDIKQEAYLRGVELPKQDGVEHDALADARWNRLAWEAING